MKLPLDLSQLVLSFVEAQTLEELLVDLVPWVYDFPMNQGSATLYLNLKVHAVHHLPNLYDATTPCGWEPHITIKKYSESEEQPSPVISIYWEHWTSHQTVTYENILTSDFSLIDSAPRSVKEVPVLVASVSHLDYGRGPTRHKVENFYQPRYLFRAKEFCRMI